MPEPRAGAESVSGKTILVTGATGFIGSHLVTRLLQEGATVHALRRAGSDGHRPALPPAVRSHSADIADAAALGRIIATVRPEIVFHLAADTSVRHRGAGWMGVDRSIHVNLCGTLAMLRATLESSHPVQSFVRAGGLEEYGTGPAPFVETQRERPVSSYSASQVAATHYCEMLQALTPTAIVTLRLALVYGPGQSERFLIPSVIRSCLRGAPIRITAGTQRRDVLYVEDAVDALVRAAARPTLRGAILNVASGVGPTVRELVERIVELSGTPVRPEFGAAPPRAGDIEYLVADTARVRAALGWLPRVGLDDGLRRTIAAFASEPAPPRIAGPARR